MSEKKTEAFVITITGPGVSVKQEVSPAVAQRAIALVITANAPLPQMGTENSIVAESAEISDASAEIANIVKAHPEFASLIEPVFHGKNFWRKIAAVLYCADRPLTGGQISRTLQDLSVKADPSNVRKYLYMYLRDLIKKPTSAGSVYKLSGTAQAKFLNEVRAHRGN